MLLTLAKQTWKKKHAADKAQGLSPENVTRIAVIKHAALGDLVHIRPMLISLRREFPNAKITLDVISHYMRGIPHDLIDELHVTAGKKSSFKEVWRSITSLGAQDIIFDISATTRSFWMTLLTPAKLKIGYIHKGIHRLVYDIAIPRAHYRFEAETFAEQLHTIGIGYDWPLRYDMPQTERLIDEPYIVYFPTASTPDKCWSTDNYAELIKQAVQRYPGYKHVVLSGMDDWEKNIATTIHKQTGERAELFEGGDQTEALISHAALLISADTGIRNLAIAYNTPTLGIFTPLTATIFGYRPLCGKHLVIYSKDDSPINVDKVISGIDKILQ